MSNLNLSFQFSTEESQICTITICDSSFFSIKILGDQSLKTPIYEFFDAYLTGNTTSLPLKESFTPFSENVYKSLVTIPFGKTTTYKDLAILSGYERGYRAVGNCLKKNPFPLAVPCHRVLLSNGDLGGFAFGKRVKEKLLAFEAYI